MKVKSPVPETDSDCVVGEARPVSVDVVRENPGAVVDGARLLVVETD